MQPGSNRVQIFAQAQHDSLLFLIHLIETKQPPANHQNSENNCNQPTAGTVFATITGATEQLAEASAQLIERFIKIGWTVA